MGIVERGISLGLEIAVGARDPNQIGLGNELLSVYNSVVARGYEDPIEDPHEVDRRPFIFEDERIRHDYGNRRLEVDGKEVPLTQGEHRLLLCLTQTPDRLVENHVLAGPGDKSRDESALRDVMKTRIARLRRKLDGPNPQESCIKSVRGAGYRYHPRGQVHKEYLQQPSG